MTTDEVIRHYMIPKQIMAEYERLKYRGAAADPIYDDLDLERISLLMTLHDIGLNQIEIAAYMESALAEQPSEGGRMQILEQKREELLSEIHIREKCLEQLDYLRYQQQNN